MTNPVRARGNPEADGGPLSAAQLRAIRKAVPQGKSKSVKSSLF